MSRSRGVGAPNPGRFVRISLYSRRLESVEDRQSIESPQNRMTQVHEPLEIGAPICPARVERFERSVIDRH